MLYRNLLAKALESRREEFLRFDKSWRESVTDYCERLRGLSGLSSEEVRARAELARISSGALPSTELDSAGSMVVPFGKSWATHEEARGWAMDALASRVTFAADGSQLTPGKELSLPVAVVQVAWFENPHSREHSYEKQARSEIVSPEELLSGADERIKADTVVDLHRFRLEIEETARFLEKKRGWEERKERTPVAFLDGTLLISIALPRTRIQDAYVNSLVRLVNLSREMRVPLVGFIDQSYARDLVRLLDVLKGRSSSQQERQNLSIYDAQFLHAEVAGAPPILERWGTRTSFCYSLREGFEDESGKPLIGFTYLQTTGEGLPARLDVPAWVYEAGLLDDVVDAVRAECIVGLGYPYAIETADAAAVISQRERAEFLRVVQEFADRERLTFGLSRKSTSKVRRR
ncbi:MAG: DNA double-strand break repair nuclease NurA [Pyrinomonadaceae bacterium]|nr:DNA double-strand break repair nuclease NurA [Pyrinomonadaceae bacterium]